MWEIFFEHKKMCSSNINKRFNGRYNFVICIQLFDLIWFFSLLWLSAFSSIIESSLITWLRGFERLKNSWKRRKLVIQLVIESLFGEKLFKDVSWLNVNDPDIVANVSARKLQRQYRHVSIRELRANIFEKIHHFQGEKRNMKTPPHWRDAKKKNLWTNFDFPIRHIVHTKAFSF